MAYAHRNDIYDADTHMMEPPNWLVEFADAKVRPYVAEFAQDNPVAKERAESEVCSYEKRQQDSAAYAEQSFMSMKPKICCCSRRIIRITRAPKTLSRGLKNHGGRQRRGKAEVLGGQLPRADGQSLNHLTT
jgi:hypothetical protein